MLRETAQSFVGCIPHSFEGGVFQFLCGSSRLITWKDPPTVNTLIVFIVAPILLYYLRDIYHLTAKFQWLRWATRPWNHWCCSSGKSCKSVQHPLPVTTLKQRNTTEINEFPTWMQILETWELWISIFFRIYWRVVLRNAGCWHLGNHQHTHRPREQGEAWRMLGKSGTCHQ